MPNMLSGHNSCCGIYLISSFSIDPQTVVTTRKYNSATGKSEEVRETAEAQFMWNMAQVKTACSPTTRKGKLVEVVVTDSQMSAYPGWAAILKREGFKLISRFDNSSGTICNVLHWMHSEMTDVPDWYANAEPAPVKAPTIRTRIVRAAAKVAGN